jgi:5'(3')-deoxyribonucleotidase
MQETPKPRFLVDVDEVLVDFQTPAFAHLERLFGRKVTSDDYTVWDMFALMSEDEKTAIFAEVAKPGYCRALEPKPGAVEAIKTLRRMVDVYAVTSHFPGPTWVHERDAQLKEDFGFSGKDIIHTSAKFLVRGDYFLDDNPTHVNAWAAEHPTGIAMLWHIPNTRRLGFDDLRVRTWDEVIARVEAVKLWDEAIRETPAVR